MTRADMWPASGYRPSVLTRNRIIVAILSGASLAATSPPLNLWWFHWVVFVPLLLVMEPGNRRGNMRLAYLCGVAALCTNFSWLAETILIYSNIPMPLAIVAVLLYGIVFGLPWAFGFSAAPALRNRYGSWWIAILPAWIVVLEFYVWSLFPWYHGSTQYRALPIVQVSSITGVLGVSWLILMFNCALAECGLRKRESRALPRIPLGIAVGLALANALFGAWRIQRIEQETASWPTVKITQVQHEIRMKERMQKSAVETLRDWKLLSDRLMDEEVDLVVWSEGSILHDPRPSSAYRIRGFLQNVTRNLNAPLLLGAGYAERRVDPDTGRKYREYRNSVYYIGLDGEIQQRYDKMVPLPFGEYIPLADTFPILKEWIKGPGDFEPGAEPVVFEGPGFTFTVPICYEAILGSFMREQLADADLIINVTNDGWFGTTLAPHQHAMLTVNRAVELGIPLYRVAYTGVSMSVDPTGKIHAETKPYEEVARVVDVKPGRIDTPYRRLGDWFPALCAFISLGAGLGLRRRSVTPDTHSA